MRRRLEIRIEELVLSGFERADGERIAAATRSELERLGRAGPAWRPASAAVVRAAPVRLAPNSGPQALGVAVARSIHAGAER